MHVKSAGRVAYLVNQYPKVSHTFIRREIQALEQEGLDVYRLAIRGWQGELADQEDLRERDRTRYLLRAGTGRLIVAMARAALLGPRKFVGAVALAFRLSRGSDRPLAVHIAYLAEACVVLDWVSSAGIQHIHAHFGTNPAEVAMLVNALGGPSYSFTVHGPEEFDRPMALHLGEKITRAAFVVGVSSFGASQLQRWVGLDQWPKIRVVHCGIDEAFYRHAPIARSFSNRFVCVGRLCEQKGQLLLVLAAAELAKRGWDFELVLAGDGELRGAVEDLVQRCGLQDRVRITGWISSDQVRREILASRALVLPSSAEGLPVVIMEAMALRCPVLSTYIAGIPELVQPGVTGWLIPAGDVGGLVEAMETVLGTPESELTAMGARARDRVILRHSARSEARKLLKSFHESIAGG